MSETLSERVYRQAKEYGESDGQAYMQAREAYMYGILCPESEREDFEDSDEEEEADQ